MKTLATLLALATALAGGVALGNPGQETVNAMNARLFDQRLNCGASSMPAFLCTGVIVRATDNPRFWVPQEKNIKSGAISVSYLRNDAKFKILVFRRNNGFTLYPVLHNPPNNRTYEVLCAYPNDGGTDNRTDRGCGDHVQNPEVQTYCDLMGIMTGEEWNRRFRSNKVLYSEICAFDVSDRRDAHAGPAFMASINARNLGGETLFSVQNELRIATWGNNPPFDPPVESTFYITPPASDTSGLENARANQIEWWWTARRYLPLVKLNLPQTLAANPSFAFDPVDQAIQPITRFDGCPRYIDNARFENLPATPTSPAMRSLVIVPTACGRMIGDDQTNNFFNELVYLYYRTPDWQGTSASHPQNILSMRRQLTCHFAKRRQEVEWTLEPKRPNTTFQESVAKRCDN